MVATLSDIQFSHFDDVDHRHPLEDQLCNPVSTFDAEGVGGISVEHGDLEFTPVPRIHCSGRVDHRDAMFGGQSGARVHKTGPPFRDGDGHAGGNQGTLTGFQDNGLPGAQVHSGIPRPRVDRQRQIRVQSLNAQLEPLRGLMVLVRVDHSAPL